MRLVGVTQRFVEGLAETVDSLNSGSDHNFFNPTVALLSALILTSTAAFSSDLKVLVIIFVLGMLLILITRSSMKLWARVNMIVLGWAMVVAAPLPFITPGAPLTSLSLGLVRINISFEGIYEMAIFISRVVAAAGVFTSFTCILGWKRVLNGLEGLKFPSLLTMLLSLSIMHIPLFLREASKMLSSREARVIKGFSLRQIWGIMATIVGELLIRSTERAWKLEKAVNARSLTGPKINCRSHSRDAGIRDLLLLSFTFLLPVSILLLGL